MIGRNVLFNDTLNTFYLRLYGVRHMVKEHSDSERGNPLPPNGLLFYMDHPTDRIIHTSRGALAGIRKADNGGMWEVYIKEPLLLIKKSSPCIGGCGFPLYLSAALCLITHNCKQNVLSVTLN